ncbi:MAG TPA: hypothetical protein VH500_04315 [Nitrososphaeraceae archaeon]|jgi:hypothetical protein
MLASTTVSEAFAFKLTASSFEDGVTRGMNDAQCDSNQCHGHGYDPSCPSGHTKTFCRGYAKGYSDGWGQQSGGEISHRQTNDGSNGDTGDRGSNTGGAESGYRLTVNVPSHPFGESSVNIEITTENGYHQFANVGTAGGSSHTFEIPPNEGNSVRVCVYTGFGIARGQNCHSYAADGGDMEVSLSAPS